MKLPLKKKNTKTDRSKELVTCDLCVVHLVLFLPRGPKRPLKGERLTCRKLSTTCVLHLEFHAMPLSEVMRHMTYEIFVSEARNESNNCKKAIWKFQCASHKTHASRTLHSLSLLILTVPKNLRMPRVCAAPSLSAFGWRSVWSRACVWSCLRLFSSGRLFSQDKEFWDLLVFLDLQRGVQCPLPGVWVFSAQSSIRNPFSAKSTLLATSLDRLGPLVLACAPVLMVPSSSLRARALRIVAVGRAFTASAICLESDHRHHGLLLPGAEARKTRGRTVLHRSTTIVYTIHYKLQYVCIIYPSTSERVSFARPCCK